MINISETNKRLFEKLYHDLGNKITCLLADKNVNEIMVNPDGKLWIDSSIQGLTQQGELSNTESIAIIDGIAGIHNLVVNHHSPSLEAELPFYKSMRGERFTGQIHPIVTGPSFSIRKKSEIIYTLEDYVETKRLTETQLVILRELIKERKNILVCGGPGSGKTTVTNALIKEAVKNNQNQRFIILEDLPELQCTAPNKVSMLTSVDVNMTALLRAAMRMRPDRILIGEVRGGEALDMLKAWNTGCPGGICTVHANGAVEAVQRITDLAMEAGLTVPPIKLISHTVDAIISVIRKENEKGFIKEILSLGEYRNDTFQCKKMA
jgi:P-type conjugative transfer ATPase TrbB